MSALSVHSSDDAERSLRFHRDWRIVAVLVVMFVAVRVLIGVPWWAGAGVLVLSVLRVSPKLLAIAIVLLLGARSGHVVATLQPLASGPLDAVAVELVSDPRPADGGWSAQAKHGDDRMFLNVRVGASPDFGSANVGDVVVISGSLRGSEPESGWAISRRITGSVSVTDARIESRATGLTGAANGLRALYSSGAAHLNPADLALFRGLVYGDDRGQDPVDADSFRASGLGHLLAVSGQNVAFVLLLAAPILGRFRSASVRVVLAFGLLVGFGFLTRFEASVTRALVMAGLALLAHAVGRQSSAAVVLVPAVGGLLVFDPLMAWSLAFQLSVAATTGMVVLAPRLADHVPGPKVFQAAASATLGAQIFVAPLLLSTFGRLSLLALPANLLAGPAAAAVMMWGLVLGPLAGVVPRSVASIVHVPTELLIWWITFVADRAAAISVGHFSRWHLGLLIVGVCGLLADRVVPTVDLARVGRVLIVITVCTTVLVARPLQPGMHDLAEGISVARSSQGHDVVVFDGDVDVADVLEQVRSARLGRVDLLIATSGSRQLGLVVFVLSQRVEISEIWAPVGHQVPGAVSMREFEGTVGTLVISQNASTNRVEITEAAVG